MRKKTIFCLFSCVFLCFYTAEGIKKCNDSELSDSKSMLIQDSTERYVGITFFLLTVLLALFCNCLIIHVIRVNKNMHTTTNYLIISMALGDLFSTILTTILTTYSIHFGFEWKLDSTTGQIYCRSLCPLYYFFMMCSIYSLVTITFGRFMAVTRPLKYKKKYTLSKYVLFLIWVSAGAVAGHYAQREITFCSFNEKYYCIPSYPMDQTIFMLTLGFFVPHLIILVLYTVIIYKLYKRKVPGEKQKECKGQSSNNVAKKVTMMIICILVSFDVSYLPVFVVFMAPVLLHEKTTASHIELLSYKLLLVTNGISNLIIYAVFNENFRAAFKKTLWFLGPMQTSVKKRMSRRVVSVSKSGSVKNKTKDLNSTEKVTEQIK